MSTLTLKVEAFAGATIDDACKVFNATAADGVPVAHPTQPEQPR